MKHIYALVIFSLSSTFYASAMEQQPAAAHEQRTCSICCDILRDKIQATIQLPCSKKHNFHYKCLSTWRAEPEGDRCPLCRANIKEVFVNPEAVSSLTEELNQAQRHIVRLGITDILRESTIDHLKEQLIGRKKKIKQLHMGLHTLKRTIQDLKGHIAQEQDAPEEHKQETPLAKKAKITGLSRANSQ